MNWIHPKTILGSVAEGDKYLKRPKINEAFWRAITKGEHLRITAPRRVGKSSVMKDIEKNPIQDTLVIYENIESDTTSQQFYKRLWNMITARMKKHEALLTKLNTWVKSRSIGEISVEGSITISKSDIDYKSELLSLIENLGDQPLQVVLLLDEFPDVLVSITRNEGPEKAAELLHTLRSIRGNEKFKKFSLVIAGSIGLEHVVTSIDRLKLINDLPSIIIPALTEDEAHELLNIQLNSAAIKIGIDERSHLLKTVQYLLPYHLQILITLCDEIAYGNNDPVITKDIIDQAYNKAVANNEYFSDWETRLSSYLDEKDYRYCSDILTRCAHNDSYTLQLAFDFSKKVPPAKGYKALIDDVLIKDGYLIAEGMHLRFQSPFLKEWWKNRHPEFEIED